MKKTFIIIVITTILSFQLSICFVNAHGGVVNNVMEKLNCSREDAIYFIGVVETLINKIQNNISRIASHNTSKRAKNLLVRQTINNYFLSPSSWIQVTSLNRKSIKTYSIDRYLRRLSRLSNQPYTEVELLFVKDYLALGNIYGYEDDEYGNAYEFNVSMWQIFRGRNGDSIVYADGTLKMFCFIFFKPQGSDAWCLRVKNVTARETVELSELEKQLDRIIIR